MSTRKQIRQMTGEAMREIGVLLIVFAPLDALFNRDALTRPAIVAIVVLAAFSFIWGLYLGVERS